MKILALLILAALEIPLSGVISRSLTEFRASEALVPETKQEARLKPELYKITSFGHLNSAIDFLWLKGFQDALVTTHMHWSPGEHPPVFYAFQSAVTLDPAFLDAYLAGGSFLSIVRNDVEGAREILEMGAKWRDQELPRFSREFQERYWSSGWNIDYELLYLYLFPLRDLQKSALLIRRLSLTPSAPAFLKDMEKRLTRPEGLYEIGLNVTKTLLRRENEEKVKLELEREQRALEIALSLLRLNIELTHKKWSTLVSERGDRGDQDPWGGRYYVDPNGQVRTTTEFEPMYGLDGSLPK